MLRFSFSLNRFCVWLAALACLVAAPAQAGITVDWVTVGDAGNTADTNGFGAVANSYRIMKFEFTIQQYVGYLNAVDPDGTNPDSIYNSNMGSDIYRGGIRFTAGNAAASKYESMTNMADKPVGYVNWFRAARVANWLEAGGNNYGSSVAGSAAINSGAYTLNNATSGDAPAVNPGAKFYIPTEDQWYKAAYYKGGGTNSGYWLYPTQSDTAPTPVTADSTGIGSAGNVGNFANFNNGAPWNGTDTLFGQGNPTTVGTNGGPSAYGAFDMGGNVIEWNDLTGAAGPYRRLRGGDWYNTADDSNAGMSSASRHGEALPSYEQFPNLGFRLASYGVPEIDPNGLSSALGLIVGGLGLLERRRYGR